MKALRVIFSIILKTVSLPFLMIGLFGLSIFAISNLIYKFSSNNQS